MRFKTAGRNFSQAPATRFAQPKPKVTVEHYKTPEHRAWASAVVKRAGMRCEDCSASGTRLYADHILEIRDRPDLALSLMNGRALCASCHGKKTSRVREERLRSAPDK
jgi:5-methylcytosine-specific restriction endonuclease McrA